MAAMPNSTAARSILTMTVTRSVDLMAEPSGPRRRDPCGLRIRPVERFGRRSQVHRPADGAPEALPATPLITRDEGLRAQLSADETGRRRALRSISEREAIRPCESSPVQRRIGRQT